MARYSEDYGARRFQGMPEPGRGAYRGVGNWGAGRRGRYVGGQGGYDADFEGIGNRSLDYGREYRFSYEGDYRPRWGSETGAGYGVEYRRGPLYGGDYHRGRYAAEYRGGDGGEFRKSRWETDYGDPFHDREQHTPIRVLRGSFEESWDELRRRHNRPRAAGYGREYRGRDWRY
jgi:hypothetical protein